MLKTNCGLPWKPVIVALALVPMSFAQEQSQEPAQQPASTQPQITLGLRPTKQVTPAPQTQPGSSTAVPAPVAAIGNRLLNYHVQVAGQQQWTDTKIDLVPGDKVEFVSSGKLSFMARDCSPDGLARGWADLIRSLPVNNAGNCTLIGRIGEADTSVPFAVGSKKEVDVRRGGRLFLGVNQTKGDTSTGQYDVSVNIVSSAKSATIIDTAAPA